MDEKTIPVLFVGGPLDGTVAEMTGNRHEWVHPLDDGSKLAYLRNTLRARGSKVVIFTMGLRETRELVAAVMMHPRSLELWVEDDGE